MTDYDIIVIGGGMVGAAAAASCARSGRRVAVIESQEVLRDIDGNHVDLRVSAISPASQQMLGTLGAWDVVQPFAGSYQAMQVWDAQVPPRSADVLRFDAAEAGVPALGAIVENRRIVAALHEVLARQQEIDVFAPASADAIDVEQRQARVTLADKQSISARLIIGADGAGSTTRALAGIEARIEPYNQRGFVTHVETELPHQHTAWQRFLPTGPIALLPLYDGRCSVVWSTSPEHADQLLSLDDGLLCEKITAASDGVLGDVVAVDRRAAFPLQRLHAEHYVRPRVALVGDAAHAVHPLAGQGVNLGFADVRTLVDALAQDPGELAGLRRYERSAKSDNLLMMTSLDALHRLFTHPSEVVARLRSAGLSVLNRTAPAKQMLIRHAMGWRGAG